MGLLLGMFIWIQRERSSNIIWNKWRSSFIWSSLPCCLPLRHPWVEWRSLRSPVHSRTKQRHIHFLLNDIYDNSSKTFAEHIADKGWRIINIGCRPCRRLGSRGLARWQEKVLMGILPHSLFPINNVFVGRLRGHIIHILLYAGVFYTMPEFHFFNNKENNARILKLPISDISIYSANSGIYSYCVEQSSSPIFTCGAAGAGGLLSHGQWHAHFTMSCSSNPAISSNFI